MWQFRNCLTWDCNFEEGMHPVILLCCAGYIKIYKKEFSFHLRWILISFSPLKEKRFMFYYFNKFSILLFVLVLIKFSYYCSYHFMIWHLILKWILTGSGLAFVALYIVCIICTPKRLIKHTFLCNRIEGVPMYSSCLWAHLGNIRALAQ